MYWFGVWFGRIEKNDLQLVYTRLNQLRTHVLSQSMSTKGWLLSVTCVCVCVFAAWAITDCSMLSIAFSFSDKSIFFESDQKV